jgi:hypothetical protein
MKKKNEPENSDILSKTIDVLVPDLVKKILITGIGGIFLTEEAIKKMISEVTLPKDMANFVLQQSTKSKNELVRIISEEVGNFISQIRVDREILKVLRDIKINIKMEVNFEPREGQEKLLAVQTSVERPDQAATPKPLSGSV